MIVLTGGAGFIGSCFLKKLNSNGRNDIIVVDHLGKSNKWRNLLCKNYEDFVHKNVFLNDLIQGKYNGGITDIIHFGACSDTTENDADYMLDNNYKYSIQLAKYALDNNIRFIYASSAATYGSGSLGYSDLKYDELMPLNVYGYSKHLFDLWVLKNGLDNKFVGLKFFNVFGPNEYHKSNMASMVFKSFNQIISTGKVNLFKSNANEFGDGKQMRDFVYIKDVNDIVWNIFSRPEVSGIFNIGTGKARNWNDLANSVFKAMSLEPKIEYIDMPDNLKNQYQNFTEADMNKLKEVNCAITFPSLEENVNDYVKNYLMKNYEIY